MQTLITHSQDTDPGLLTPVNISTAMDRLGKLAKRSSNATVATTTTTSALLQKLLQLAAENKDKFEPRSVANMCYGVALLARGSGDSGMPPVLQELAMANARVFSPAGCSTVLWSFAIRNDPSPQLFASLAIKLDNFLHRCSARDVSTSLWSFAVTGNLQPRLFARTQRFLLESSAGESEHRLRAYNLQDLSTLLYSFAVLGHDCPKLCEAVCAEVVRQAQGDGVEIRQHELHSFLLLIWSLACLDVLQLGVVRDLFQNPPPKLLAALTRAINTERRTLRTLATQANQLHYVRLAWDQQYRGIPSKLLDALEQQDEGEGKKKNWVHEHKTSQLNAGYQSTLAVSDALTRAFAELGEHDVRVNALVGDNGEEIQVDFFLPAHRFVVEIEGKHNFALDGTTPLGVTRFKHRLLQRAGFTLCRLHLGDFSALGSEQQRAILLGIAHHALRTSAAAATVTRD